MKTLQSLFIFEVNIMDNGKYISISEASRISGKHIATIYKGIRKGRIQAKPVEAHANTGEARANTFKQVLKQDIIRLYGLVIEAPAKPVEYQVEARANTGEAMGETSRSLLKADIRAEMKEVIEDFFSTKQAELMKPIEQQALYKLGSVEKENTFLRAKVETLLQENTELQEKIKLLPGPAIIEEKEKSITALQQEKEALEGKINTLTAPIESVNQILMENAHNLTVLQKCKSELMEKLKQKEQEKEEALKELEARLKAEAEEAQRVIVEAWKKELETERNKSWWKKLFS